MISWNRGLALACMAALSTTGLARADAGTCGFVAPLAGSRLFHRGAGARSSACMTLSDEREAPISSSPDASTSSEVGGRRRGGPEAPPDINALQTENQRRRALPLSRLKRVKPKRRKTVEEEGEFRPLVAKTDRESVLRGEDYWIDYRELDAKTARKEAKARAPAPDQFAQSKIRAEISNPYKQNWILIISIAIVAIAGFVQINPGILDNPTLITFPTEL